METTKWRIDAITMAIDSVKTGVNYFQVPALAEFCLLQFRYCCELIAIGCIAIHKDVPQTRRFQKMWNAHEIMSAFEKIKPQFFPHPIRSEETSKDKWIQHPVDGALTKDELIRMYNFFGGLLHTGTFEAFADPNKKQHDFKMIEDFYDKLRKLLNEHIYYLYDGKTQVRVLMQDKVTGRVAWNVLQRMS